MIDVDKAFDVCESGVVLTDDSDQVIAYFTGGSGSPVGQQAPVPTIYVQQENADVWQKFGPLVTDWRLVASSGDLCIGGVGANYVFTPPQCVGGGDASGN